MDPNYNSVDLYLNSKHHTNNDNFDDDELETVSTVSSCGLNIDLKPHPTNVSTDESNNNSNNNAVEDTESDDEIEPTVEEEALEEEAIDVEDAADFDKNKKYRMNTTSVNPGWTPPSPGCEWNERFQSLLDDTTNRFQDVAMLLKEFENAIMPIVKQVIDEMNVENDKKKFVPQCIAGTGGGAKFIHDGVFYKMVDERTVRLYGGETAAGKVYTAELRANSAILRSGLDHICVPLSAVVTYKGMRVYAASLLPIDSNTLVYGSSDTGKKINHRAFARKIVKEMAENLNLAPHCVMGATGDAALLYGPIDMEGHHSNSDGRFYMLDTARMFPLFPAKVQRFCFLRPELVKGNPVPLSSDAFSRFATSASGRLHDKRVKQTARRMKNEVFAACALYFSTQSVATSSRAVEIVHKYGINLRFMGPVTTICKKLSTPEITLRTLEIEMIARTFKRYLYAKLPRRVRVENSTSPPHLQHSVTNTLPFSPSALQAASPNVHLPTPSARYRLNSAPRTPVSPRFFDENSPPRYKSTRMPSPRSPSIRYSVLMKRGFSKVNTLQKTDSIVSADSFLPEPVKAFAPTNFSFSSKWNAKIRSGTSVEVVATQLFGCLLNDNSFWDRLMIILHRKFGFKDSIDKSKINMDLLFQRISELTGFSIHTNLETLEINPVVKTCAALDACRNKLNRDPKITEEKLEYKLKVWEARIGRWHAHLVPLLRIMADWYASHNELDKSAELNQRIVDINTAIVESRNLTSVERNDAKKRLAESLYRAALSYLNNKNHSDALKLLLKTQNYVPKQEQDRRNEIKNMLRTLATELQNQGLSAEATKARFASSESACSPCLIQ